jgi:translation initiation factor IF-2
MEPVTDSVVKEVKDQINEIKKIEKKQIQIEKAEAQEREKLAKAKKAKKEKEKEVKAKKAKVKKKAEVEKKQVAKAPVKVAAVKKKVAKKVEKVEKKKEAKVAIKKAVPKKKAVAKKAEVKVARKVTPITRPTKARPKAIKIIRGEAKEKKPADLARERDKAVSLEVLKKPKVFRLKKRAAPKAVAPTPARKAKAPAVQPLPSAPQVITLSEGVTVKELAEKTGIKSKDIIRKLIEHGTLVTINQPLNKDLAEWVAKEFNFQPEIVSYEDEAIWEDLESSGEEGEMVSRDPVVTIMGHVDHGKTSLLDAIRESNIIATEHGGITQKLGAYSVAIKGRRIVFLDTPGHEAFTMMRARGAEVTDIVVLVVAADDGVKPQTIEAIHHAKAANVAIIVAINKIDKPEANPDRVKKQLSEHEILVEEWGGKVVSVEVSAKQQKNLDLLLEMILLVTDMLELKANAHRIATGTVLEARLDKAKGPLATVLVQNGSLKVGQPFIAGSVYGKVRAMIDDKGNHIKEAGPSTPLEVMGLAGLPKASDRFQVVSEEWKARQIGSFRQSKLREETLLRSSRLTLEHLHQQIKEGTVKELPLILKADVQGSVEVLSKSLQDLETEKVKIRIIHSAPGAITESDVLLATASNAIIIGFNVRPERGASELADKESVDIRLHTVIYNVTNEIRNAMVGLLDPTFKEAYLGRAEVKETFKIPKIGLIAGCTVIDGKVARNAEVRLLRDNIIIYEGKISSLKRFKEDVSEVKNGFECGIGIENFNDIKIGDVLETYRMEKVIEQSL